MDAAKITCMLAEEARKNVTVTVRETVTSTNTLVKELAENGAPEGTVLIAEQQTAGKGRLGRSFHSPKGTGLYMSILLRPQFSPKEALYITTAAAVAVAEAAEAVTGRQAMIKWVNDVYLDGRKVCGILTEAATEHGGDRLRYAVLGIGINVKEPEGGFPEEICDVAGALCKDDPPAGTGEALAAHVINNVFGYYSHLTEKTFLEGYKRRSLLTGMKISFTKGEEQSRGTVLGIDDEARLLVRLEDGTETAFSAGEVDISKEFLRQVRGGSACNL